MNAVTDFEQVKAEMTHRGIWDAVLAMPLPNRVIGKLDTLEIFYHQEAPELAVWVQCNNRQEFDQCYARLCRGGTSHRPQCGPGRPLPLSQLPSEPSADPLQKITFAEGQHRIRPLGRN